MGNSLSANEEWLQTLIQQLSPRFAEFASDILSHQVEPLISKVFQHQNLPSVDFKFTKFDFGNIPPRIENIETHKQDQEGNDVIIIDFDLEYLGNCNLQVQVLGLETGVQDIQLSARARLTMKPTHKQIPFIGGLQICFLNNPNIDYNLAGITDIIDWPPLKSKIKKELQEDIAKRCLFPHFYCIPMQSGSDLQAIKTCSTSGVLLVKLISAQDLAKKGGIQGVFRSMIGQNLPDPYAVIKLGALTFTSQVIKNSTCPQWESGFEALFILDTLIGHQVKIEFFDQDSFSKDDFIGCVVKETRDLVPGEILEENIDLINDASEEENDVSGQALVQYLYLPACSEPMDDVKYLILSIFIYSANNLIVDDVYPDTQILVQVGQEIKTSEILKDTPHPSFQEAFDFLMHNQEEDIAIQIKDVKNDSILGSIVLSPGDMPMKRKILSIDENQPMMTITLSASIKYC